MAQVIYGSEVSKDIRSEQIAALRASGRRMPKLAVILVGENPASLSYVTGKEKACTQVGMESELIKLPATTSQEELMAVVRRLNADPNVDGILCQLPLPKGLNEDQVIHAIAPDKDVDCFHPFNVGQMSIGAPTFLPCTPAGVMEMLRAYEIPVAGKRCVVLGRSNIVGKPMAMLLTQADGTVTVCHSRTPDLAALTREADILVAAVGRVGLVTADMVRPGAVVIDVAMNRNADGKLCGDVVFDEVEAKASYITPVPGGVGPMTRAMLMRNILTAARNHGA